MNLLHVIRDTDPESGGPLEALVQISEVLRRDGHRIEVVSLDSKEEAAARNFPFPLHTLGRGIGAYGYNPRLVPWLRKNAIRFDAVIVHGLWNYSSAGAWRVLRNHSTPYYVFSHGMMDPWFRNEYPLKHAAKQVFWWLAEGRVLRDATRVLFTSEEEKLRARGVFQGYSYRERVVLFGTAGADDRAGQQRNAFRTAFEALRGRRLLLFLSRIHPKKGCDLLIRSFAESLSDLPSDLDLAFAGPDQVGLMPKLQALARDFGLARRVHWLGMLKGEIKWGAFRSAEALILPSHQENFGFVVAEAMSCGVPVLISNKVNIWREIESSGAGLVEPDTQEGTSNLIRRFFKLSLEERVRIAAAARQSFARFFDIEVTARDLARAVDFSHDKSSARTAELNV